MKEDRRKRLNVLDGTHGVIHKDDKRQERDIITVMDRDTDIGDTLILENPLPDIDTTRVVIKVVTRARYDVPPSNYV